MGNQTKKLKFFVVKHPPEGLLHKVITFLEGVRDFKNEVSKDFNDNLYEYLSLRVKDYITLARAKFKDQIKASVSSHFDYQALECVYLNYQRREEEYFEHIKFNPIRIKFDNGTQHANKNMSEGTDVKISYVDTFVVRCLNYILRIGNPPKKWYEEHRKELENIYHSFLNKSESRHMTEKCKNQILHTLSRKAYAKERLRQMEESDKIYMFSSETTLPKDKDMKFRLRMYIFLRKIGFDRVWQLIDGRRMRWYSQTRRPVTYVGLGTRGRSRFTVFFDKNIESHEKNKYNFHLSWPGEKNGLVIPVKYYPPYHGSIQQYQNRGRNFSYQIKIDRKRRIVIGYCIDAPEEEIEKDLEDLSKAEGVDVNASSNLFACSNGQIYPQEGMETLNFRIRQVRDMMAQTDNLQSRYEHYIMGKKRRRKEQSQNEKLRKEIECTIANMCKSLVSSGRTHIIMEHLLNTFGKGRFKYRKFSNLNINRILQTLGLSSLKGAVARIGKKYGITVSTVHSAYTSQMCPVCGAITRENRKTQSHFKCISCHLEANADKIAALNIKIRFFDEFLRRCLCIHDHEGNWIAKNLSKESVRSV